jgi:hypothetical protein
MTDVSLLASDLTGFLAPLLPYLFRAGEPAAEEAGRAFGQEVWAKAKRLWDAVRPGVEARPAAREAAEDLGRRPDDLEAQTVFKVQLEKLLGQDPALQALVAKAMPEEALPRVVIDTREGGIDFHSTTFIGGDVVGRDQYKHDKTIGGQEFDPPPPTKR